MTENNYPSCSTCRYLRGILKYKLEKKRTDNGGINFKYIYVWKINCMREGRFEDRIEGTKGRAVLPTCSLWRSIVERSNS